MAKYKECPFKVGDWVVVKPKHLKDFTRSWGDPGKLRIVAFGAYNNGNGWIVDCVAENGRPYSGFDVGYFVLDKRRKLKQIIANAKLLT